MSVPWYIHGLSAMTAFFMLSILAVMVADVIGRYFFDESIYGGFEIVEYLLGLLIFSGFPLVSLRQEHISVSLLDNVFSGTFDRVRKLVVLVASAIAVAFIGYRVFEVAVILDLDDQVGQVLDLQIAPYIYAMSVLAGATSLLMLRIIWQYVRAWPDEPPRPPAVHGELGS
jgi:TRAP-type C4-dicarboxylate transport system permease small subunit